MNAIFERMARQGHAMEPADFEDWSRLCASIPAEQFAAAATRALGEVDPRAYAAHFRLGSADPQPLALLGMTQLADLGAALLEGLAANGVPRDDAGHAGLETLNPPEMTTSDVASLAIWSRERHLAALGRAAATVRAEPDVSYALLSPEGLLALGRVLGPLPMPVHPTPEDREAARVATGPRLSVSPQATGEGARPGGLAGTPMAESATGKARVDVEALTPPPSPLNTEPPWLTPAHPEGNWPTWAQVEPSFRARWEARPRDENALWTDVAPDYQFAYARFRSPEYAGQSFDEAELALRRDWESHGSSAPWEQVRGNVGNAWETLAPNG